MAGAGSAVVAQVGARTVPLNNLDKLFWPEDGYTKGDLVAYYTRVAPVLLPYLRDRPLVLTRYPDGIHGPSFYQKNAPPHRPAWIRTYPYHHSTGLHHYLLADEPAALTYLANLGAIEIHPWTGRIQDPGAPDFAIVDIDPAPGATWDDVRTVALLVRQILQRVGVEGFPKLSGATGVHIYCPCAPGHTYGDTAAFCAAIGRLLARVYPEKVTMERLVARRAGKVYIDYLQNRLGQTITSVYGVRPRPGAPVSAPVTWAELAAGHVPRVTIRTLFDRLAQVGDLFAPVLTLAQDLKGPTAALQG